jgi:3-phenylpropionate/trans-cinnamate dioxygenase ferredoxin subunit
VSARRRIDLLALDDLPEGTLRLVWVDGTDPVVVVHANGAVRALQGICSHEYFELDGGLVTGGGTRLPDGRIGGTLTCPLHLSRFDLVDGEALDPPADQPLAVYDVVIEDGRILIEADEGPLPVFE